MMEEINYLTKEGIIEAHKVGFITFGGTTYGYHDCV